MPLLAFVVSVPLVEASPWTPEDLVVAVERGVPAVTTARMAESVGVDGGTAVYLLRRGVPEATVAAWDPDLAPRHVARAAALGGLDEGEVSVKRVRVDAGSLTDAIYDEMTPAREAWTRPNPRRVHVERARLGVASGALLGVAGGVTFLMGAHGSQAYELPSSGSAEWALNPLGALSSLDLSGPGPDVVLMSAGVLGLVGAGVSFQFGAHEAVLAGEFPNGWAPDPR
jgi:hypothetical protein